MKILRRTQLFVYKRDIKWKIDSRNELNTKHNNVCVCDGSTLSSFISCDDMMNERYNLGFFQRKLYIENKWTDKLTDKRSQIHSFLLHVVIEMFLYNEMYVQTFTNDLFTEDNELFGWLTNIK